MSTWNDIVANRPFLENDPDFANFEPDMSGDSKVDAKRDKLHDISRDIKETRQTFIKDWKKVSDKQDNSTRTYSDSAIQLMSVPNSEVKRILSSPAYVKSSGSDDKLRKPDTAHSLSRLEFRKQNEKKSYVDGRGYARLTNVKYVKRLNDEGKKVMGTIKDIDAHRLLGVVQNRRDYFRYQPETGRMEDPTIRHMADKTILEPALMYMGTKGDNSKDTVKEDKGYLKLVKSGHRDKLNTPTQIPELLSEFRPNLPTSSKIGGDAEKTKEFYLGILKQRELGRNYNRELHGYQWGLNLGSGDRNLPSISDLEKKIENGKKFDSKGKRGKVLETYRELKDELATESVDDLLQKYGGSLPEPVGTSTFVDKDYEDNQDDSKNINYSGLTVTQNNKTDYFGNPTQAKRNFSDTYVRIKEFMSDANKQTSKEVDLVPDENVGYAEEVDTTITPTADEPPLPDPVAEEPEEPERKRPKRRLPLTKRRKAVMVSQGLNPFR